MNYTTSMSYMIQIEELQVDKDMFDFDQENIMFIFKNGFYQLQMEGLEEGRPSLMEFDSLWILPMLKSTSANTGRIDGIINRIEKDNLLIEFREKRKKIDIDTKIKYRVHFMANRTNTQMQQHAIARISQKRLSKFFFPEKPKEFSIPVDEPEYGI